MIVRIQGGFTMKRYARFLVPLLVVLVLIAVGCTRVGGRPTTQSAGEAISASAQEIIAARELSPDDVTAALKTFMPTGRHDEAVLFSSGGHSGQVYAIGIPSMRHLRTIAVFTPEPWQGWGYGSEESRRVLEEGFFEGKPILWGDTHHPSLSETDGIYDGEWLFIGDKANSRVAVIDLRDWETKQIVRNPVALNNHGGSFVTPNTEYVIEAGHYSAPLGGTYAHISEYDDTYRGLVTFWKFNRETGRIDRDRSFAIELPPYWQDLCDAGKGPTDGWVFCNSINTERATGGVEQGNPPFEAGVSQRDMDYLHIINLNKAAEVFEAGNYEMVKDFAVITLDTAIEEGLLYFAPEPKSPHGVDVSPTGEYMVVAGKLDPHVTIYSWAKIQEAIAAGAAYEDPYGVPVLDFDSVVQAQVELGLGPLHTQFDNQGYAYTSLFLDSAVARWKMGEADGTGWELVSKLPVHYNIGHLASLEGDTMEPGGGYLVAMNKWSVDRFLTTGPLLPQNFQLIDISQSGEQMQLLYDMPIGMGEPHYGQIIRTDRLQSWEVYPEVGWDPSTQSRHPQAIAAGEERIERNGNHVEIWMTAIRSHFTPEHVEIKEGDHVVWHITSLERAKDATHGFALSGYNINLSIEPGETTTIEFVADKDGVFSYYCTEFCSALHLEMKGYMKVEP
jgi:nitrous-oxide reductase